MVGTWVFHFEDWRFTLLVKGALMLVMDLMTAQGGEVGAESCGDHRAPIPEDEGEGSVFEFVLAEKQVNEADTGRKTPQVLSHGSLGRGCETQSWTDVRRDVTTGRYRPACPARRSRRSTIVNPSTSHCRASPLSRSMCRVLLAAGDGWRWLSFERERAREIRQGNCM